MGTLAVSIGNEGKKITDVVKFEVDQTYSRSELPLKADAGLDIGDVVELISSKYEKVVTAANAAGIFLERKDTALTYAFADVTFLANIDDGDTITVNGRVYTWEGTPAAADDMDFGGTVDISTDNFVAVIGLIGAAGVTTYFATTINDDVTAERLDGDVVRLRSKLPGTIGNALTIATDAPAAEVTLSGATFSGGQSTDPANGVILTRGATVDGNQLDYNGAVVATVNTALSDLGIKVIS